MLLPTVWENSWEYFFEYCFFIIRYTMSDVMFFKDYKGRYKLVPGYAFAIGDNGTLINLRFQREKKPTYNSKSGLAQVLLMSEGKYSMKYIHRLVAEAWLDNPNNYPYITHINGDVRDNRVENLRWISVDEFKQMQSNRLKAYNNNRKKNDN